MDADFLGSDRTGGEVRDDQGDVAHIGDHRVGLVDGTLLNMRSGMGMHVCGDCQAFRLADIPQPTERSTVKMDVPTEAIGIEIIEILDVGDAAALTGRCEQKGSRFTLAITSSAELFDQLPPLPVP